MVDQGVRQSQYCRYIRGQRRVGLARVDGSGLFVEIFFIPPGDGRQAMVMGETRGRGSYSGGCFEETEGEHVLAIIE